MLVWFAACAPPPEAPPPAPPHTEYLVDTAEVGLGDTAASSVLPPLPGVDPPADCSAPLPVQVSYEVIDIATEEDFDFDLRGYVVYQRGNDIVGSKPGGVLNVISAGVSSDAAGIQTLANGDLVVASPDTGDLKYIYRESGANVFLAGGLSSPNGVEVGPSDVVYFTEYGAGRVRWIDPTTGLGGDIDDGVDLPNGLAFSPDAHTLYVTANGAVGDGIVKYEWDGATYVDAGLFLAGDGSLFDGVETDVCGNVYTVDYTTGRLFRTSPDGLLREVVADIDGGGFFAALKWGNGVENWSTSTLFVTNRSQLFAFEMGISGTPDALPEP